MFVVAAAFLNQPPMWLSTASVKMRSRPIRASSTCGGTLPLRKPGILTAVGEVGRRVLDRVLEVGLRDLDRQPDLVVGQLFDLRRHPAIQAKGPCPAEPRSVVVRLAVVVVEVLEARHQPDAAEVDLVRARVVGDVVRLRVP